MKVSFYLVVSDTQSVRACKNHPDLHRNEIAIKQTLVLPDAVFSKPSLSAIITIPDEAALPQEITAEVVQNVQEAIETASGLDVRLEIVDGREQEKV